MTTILVVDDDEGILDVLSILLEDEGYVVVVAHNGKEGLACLEAKQPTIVLCDLMMPVLNGREMCQHMRANPRYEHIPFVLMSAVNSAVDRAHCRYDAILTKPFELNEVLTIVARLVALSSS